MRKVAWMVAASAAALLACLPAQAQPTGDKTARAASKVTFDFKDTPLAEVVDKLAELSGNAPLYIDPKLRGAEVTVAAKDVTYWEGVDKVADALQLIYNSNWVGQLGGDMERKLQMMEADRVGRLTGYAGPAVVKVDAVGKVTLFHAAKPIDPLPVPPSEALNLTLTYFWEDRLDPFSEEIELTKAVGPKGQSLLPEAPDARRKANTSMMMPGMKLPPAATAAFVLSLPAPDVREIAELAGVVRLERSTGEREVLIEDVLAKVGKEVAFDDWTVTVKKAEARDGEIGIHLEVKCKGQVVDTPRWWTTGSYGWYIQGGEGEKRTKGYSGAGAGRRGRKGPPPPPPPAGQTSVTFQGNFEGVVNLVLVLPKVHEVKECPFTVKNVPLP